MRPLQREVIALALAATEPYGFALCGGLALTAHGISDRATDDGDLFTNDPDPRSFDSGVDAAIAALTGHGYTVTTVRRITTFAQLDVARGQDRPERIDFGVDYRALPPVKVVGVGLVLALADASVSKLAAAFSRGYPRDYLDVDAVVRRGGVSLEALLEHADRSHPQPLDRSWLAASLRHGAELDDSDYTVYGLSPSEVAQLRVRLIDLATALEAAATPQVDLPSPGTFQTPPDRGYELGL